MFVASDFDYEFPKDLIAQHPNRDRDSSRLLHLDRASGDVTHLGFRELPTLIQPGDVVVLNASRVIKARLHGMRENGREAEILLVHPDTDDTWLVMAHPGGKLKQGRTVAFGDDALLRIVEVIGGGLRRASLTGLSWTKLSNRYGTVPLPPYIDREPTDDDDDRYQTVYARVDGSVAAPTAGLHFTTDLLDAIVARGAHVVQVVLHVGPGTFKPVRVDQLSRHRMHAEWFSVSEETAAMVNRARTEGHRVWAVGTTVIRVLETAVQDGTVQAAEGWTNLFINPPHTFHAIDCLLTNFHLPRSTLLMLVCAFGGFDRVMDAYREAVSQQYRLYSYGDAMVIT